MRKSVVFIMFLATLLLSGCAEKKDDQSQISDNQSESPAHAGSPMSGIAGVSWTLPARWVPQGDRPMRIATYTIPAAKDDPEPAECAVFYFGHDQGGDVRMNIDRWIGQFEDPRDTEESTMDVGGIRVTTVATTGTFLAPGGPAMESQGKLDNYKLSGAIVEAPGGLVFFKVVGPAATIDQASGEITAMLKSLKK